MNKFYCVTYDIPQIVDRGESNTCFNYQSNTLATRKGGLEKKIVVFELFTGCLEFQA